MPVKTFWKSLFLTLAFGAVAASGALGAPVQEAQPWKTGTSAGSMTVLTGSEVLTASASEGAVIEGKVAGTPLKIKATGLECLSCTIFNEGGSAKGSGELKFTGVSVVEPATCAVEGGSITSDPLLLDATWMNGIDWGAEFRQATGSRLAGFKLIKSGVNPCAISGSYNLTGTLAGLGSNATGVAAMIQAFSFNPTASTTFSVGLGIAGNPATLAVKALFQIHTGKLFF